MGRPPKAPRATTEFSRWLQSVLASVPREEVQKALGIDRSTLYRWLRGRDPERLVRIGAERALAALAHSVPSNQPAPILTAPGEDAMADPAFLETWRRVGEMYATRRKNNRWGLLSMFLDRLDATAATTTTGTRRHGKVAGSPGTTGRDPRVDQAMERLERIFASKHEAYKQAVSQVIAAFPGDIPGSAPKEGLP